MKNPKLKASRAALDMSQEDLAAGMDAFINTLEAREKAIAEYGFAGCETEDIESGELFAE